MSKQEKSRIDIIKSIKTPLNFFVVVVLIVEGYLSAILISGDISENDTSIIIYSMIVLIFLTVATVGFIAYKKPHSLGDPNVLPYKLEKNKIESLGIVDIFSGRSVTIEEEYSKRLEKMTQHLDIIGFGLSHFRKDYGKHFIELAGKAKVRILLLNPEFHICDDLSISDIRDKEENQEIGTIRSQVIDFIKDYKKLKKELNNNNFEVKLYNSLPTINIFRIDNEMFIGPYLVNRDSRRTITIIAKSEGELFKQHLEHFNELWDEYSIEISE